MSLTVLSVAFPFAPVMPDSVGGAEQVLSMLDRALVAMGDRSIVVAQEGSRVAGELVPIPAPASDVTGEARGRAHRHVRQAIARICARTRIDAIHLHGVDFDRYMPRSGLPTVVSLHLPLAWYPSGTLRSEGRTVRLVPVSATQAACAAQGMPLAPPVPNGVDLNRHGPAVRPRGYVLGVGRICPEKGFHHALDAARVAGVPMLLAGAVHPFRAHRRYFADEIAPRLDRHRRFLGPVSGERKRRLIAGASALVIPSLAPETSSLVAMEAAASGTPVVAFRAGALAEIVEEGRSGFLVSGADEMARRLRDVRQIDRGVCRQVAEQRFDSRTMIAAYRSLYAACAVQAADGVH